MMRSLYAVYTIYSSINGAGIYFDGEYTGVTISNGKGIVKIKKSEAKESYTVTLVGGNVDVPSDVYTFSVQNSAYFGNSSATVSIRITSYVTKYSIEYDTAVISDGEEITLSYNTNSTVSNVSYSVVSASGGFFSVSQNRITVQQNTTGNTRYGSVRYTQYESGKTGTCSITQNG